MIYRVLADAVLLFHLAFVFFVVVGALLVLRRRGVAWLHVPSAAWGALIQFAGWTCPLTPLENQLRALGGQAGYSGGFLEHYLLAALYPEGLTPGIQVALGVGVVVANVAVYGWVVSSGRAPARRGTKPISAAIQ